MNTAALLAATARSVGQARAVSVGDRPIWTYAQLLERVARLAGGLRSLPGVAPGDRIALVMKNGPAYFELLWAAWHGGLCAVPVNAKLHPKEVAYIVENSGAKLCFVSSELGIAAASMGWPPAAPARLIAIDDHAYAALARHEPLPSCPQVSAPNSPRNFDGNPPASSSPIAWA